MGDGTTIGLKLYYDEECSYPAFKVNFAKLSYGMWPTGLPYENGGLVSSQCIDCYSPNENYEWELSEMCTDLYDGSSSRCERKMKNNNNNYNNGQQQQQQQGGDGGDGGGYYNSQNNGCDYIESLMERNKSRFENFSVDYDKIFKALKTTAAVLLSVAVVVGALFLYTKYGPINKCCAKKEVPDGASCTTNTGSDDGLLTEEEKEPPAPKRTFWFD